MISITKPLGQDLTEVNQNDIFNFMADITSEVCKNYISGKSDIYLNKVEYNEGANELMTNVIFYFQVFNENGVEVKGIYKIHRANNLNCSQSSFTWDSPLSVLNQVAESILNDCKILATRLLKNGKREEIVVALSKYGVLKVVDLEGDYEYLKSFKEDLLKIK